jgi:extracellular factor (EF) 3-hydroxypalmitic acid methyl ester biosynthesis protein
MQAALQVVDPSPSLQHLQASSCELLTAYEGGQRDRIWRATSRVLAEIRALEGERVAPDAIKHAMRPVREVCAESPFVRRLQTWPRGYQGDFETIEYLVGGTNRALPNTRAWWVEQVALSSPIAIQHRGKVRRQADEIRRACARRPHARVLILACGGGRDLQILLDDAVRLDGAHLTLVDQDPDAVTLATDRARLLGATVSAVQTDAVRGLRRAEGPFDLVLAGGLFDYLQDSTIVLLGRIAHRKLAEGGVFFFTNIAADNPFRPWIEYFGDWTLIERAPERVKGLAVAAGFGDGVEVATDGTGLSLLVKAVR